PAEVRRHPEPVGPDNDLVLTAVLLSATGPVIVAWGADSFVCSSGRDQDIVRWIHSGGIEPACLGKTAAGAPRHPLYVSGDTPLEPYPNPDAYALASSRR